MENADILEDIGFSKSESVVYLTLLRSGKSKSGVIIQRTGLQSSVVHNALNTLTDKGFVAHILVGKIKQYSATDPRAIARHIEAKKQGFDAVLPRLVALQGSATALPTTEVYEGYRGISTAMLSALDDTRKGDVYKYFAGKEATLSDEAIAVFARIDDFRKRKGLVVKGIAAKGTRKLRQYAASEIRFTSQKIPPAMNIYKDSIIIFSLSEKPVAIRIRSKEIAKQYHELWDSIWEGK